MYGRNGANGHLNQSVAKRQKKPTAWLVRHSQEDKQWATVMRGGASVQWNMRSQLLVAVRSSSMHTTVTGFDDEQMDI